MEAVPLVRDMVHQRDPRRAYEMRVVLPATLCNKEVGREGEGRPDACLKPCSSSSSCYIEMVWEEEGDQTLVEPLFLLLLLLLH